MEDNEGHLSIEPKSKKLKGYRDGNRKEREKKHKRTDDNEINVEKRKKHRKKVEEWNDLMFGEKENKTEERNFRRNYKIIYLLNFA